MDEAEIGRDRRFGRAGRVRHRVGIAAGTLCLPAGDRSAQKEMSKQGERLIRAAAAIPSPLLPLMKTTEGYRAYGILLPFLVQPLDWPRGHCASRDCLIYLQPHDCAISS